MGKKTSNLTKKRIVSAAWKLFYEQGYENTTIDEIVEESCTSRGSFYHYFDSKDALLSSLSYVFDEKYEEIAENLDWNQNCFDILIQINRELFDMIENTISIDLLAQLYSSQLVTSGEKHLLDHNRVYYKFLRKIVIEGQKREELTKRFTHSQTHSSGGVIRSSNTAHLSMASSPASSDLSAGKTDWEKQKREQAKTRKREARLKETEEKIASLEESDREIDEELSREEVFTDLERVTQLTNRKAQIALQLEKLYDEWAVLAE